MEENFFHEIEQRLRVFDWNEVMYDPLQDIIEASTDEEKQELADMQQLINDLYLVYARSPEQAARLMEKYWKDMPMEHWIERIKDETMKGQIQQESYKGLEQDHVIANEVLNKAEIEIMLGRKCVAYNTEAYFLSQRQVNFFNDKQSANAFILANADKAYKFLEIDSVQDLLRKIPYGSVVAEQEENNYLTIKQSSMNEQNVQYLKDNIKYMGFGEGLAADLEKNISTGVADFQLHFKAEIGKKPFEAALNFRKSDSTDMYFFNNYTAKLERNNGEQMSQTFYLDKGKGITMKEAFNLLEGRAVYKELNNKNNEPYKAWVQLDFGKHDKHGNNEVKQYHENYGYDLREAVGKFAIAELNDPEKEKNLIASLQKGNLQSVSIDKHGGSEQMFIEANPQFKTVNVYNGQLQRVQKEELGQYRTASQAAAPEKNEVKEGQKKIPVKKEKAEKNLLPKKRTRNSKALGIS